MEAEGGIRMSFLSVRKQYISPYLIFRVSQYYFYTSNIFLPAAGTNLLAWSVEVLADLLGYCLLSYDFLISMHLVYIVATLY